MTDQEKILLIVLTKTVKVKMAEMIEADYTEGDMQDELDNLDNIRLFHFMTPKDEKDNTYGRVALPFSDGKKVLLLTQNEGDSYFVAVDFWCNTTTNIQDPNNIDLAGSFRCQILDNHQVDSYQHYAIDHERILSEVHNLPPWRRHESTNIEEQKWSKYLELYKKIIDGRKVDFTISNIKIGTDKISATVDIADDTEIIDKLKDAKGEEVTSVKRKLGMLRDITNSRVVIEMEKGKGGFKVPSVGSSVECHGEKFKLESLGNKQAGDRQTIDFKYQGFDFIAQCIQKKTTELKDNTKQQSGDDDDETSDEKLTDDGEIKVIHVDFDSIVPQPIQCSIDLFSDEYQVGVMKRCFTKVKKLPIWQVLSGNRVSKLPSELAIDLESTQLNDEQKKAVQGAVGAEELFLIWGPPGTGKTEVIKEIAKQENLLGNKVLITSQTNTAVDNALARLYDAENSYPFRIAKEGYELEGEDANKVPFINTSPRFYLDFLEKNIDAANDSGEGRIKHIRRQFRQAIVKSKKKIEKKDKSDTELREFQQIAELYQNKINVVGATLMEAGKSIPVESDDKKKWKNKLCYTTSIAMFDTVIIDEVSKATPPELFIPISLGKKLVLVGDHKQLPPMFKMLSGDDSTLEQWAKDAEIPMTELEPDNTIFEKLWRRHVGHASTCRAMLTTQYRMHPAIQSIISPFYTDEEGELSCGLSEDEIINLGISHNFFMGRPTLWLGTKRESKETKEGTSYFNVDEIEKVGKILDKLAEIKDKTMSVGIITFYGAQLRKLKYKYQRTYGHKFGNGKLVFGTVDRFQGRECDVIICSLVRNNDSRFIGFASKTNRINVAFSRARKALIILGSKEQFAYESKDEKAKDIYHSIYEKCHKPKPKELE